MCLMDRSKMLPIFFCGVEKAAAFHCVTFMASRHYHHNTVNHSKRGYLAVITRHCVNILLLCYNLPGTACAYSDWEVWFFSVLETEKNGIVFLYTRWWPSMWQVPHTQNLYLESPSDWLFISWQSDQAADTVVILH